MASKTNKSTVRAVPDFSKLHNKWEHKLQTGKACVKKPCTVVHEFDLTVGGAKVERARTRSVSGKKETTREEFSKDSRALRSIINNEGVAAHHLTGRATVAGAKHTQMTKPVLRQSEYSSRQNRFKENGTAKSRLPTTKPMKRKATGSPNSESTTQKDVAFETDQNALKSIIENQGISLEEMNKAVPKREGLTEGRMSTYSRVPVERASMFASEARTSTYSRVPVDRAPVDRASMFNTDFRTRVMSRFNMGNNRSPAVQAKSPGTELKRDSYRVFESRSSMYQPGAMSARKTLMQKPMRVLVKSTPGKSAERVARPSSLKVMKWKEVLEEAKDPVKKVLSFADENDAPDAGTLKLQRLEQKEHELQEQIANLERSKQERKRQRRDSQSGVSGDTQSRPTTDTRHMLPSAGQDFKRLEVIKQSEKGLESEITKMEKAKQERLQPQPIEDENPLPPNTKEQLRNPFQQLSSSEIAKRSLHIPADSDSDCDDACGSGSGSSSEGGQKYPQSPLAKDSSCKLIKPNTLSHGVASKVRHASVDAKSPARSRSKTKENILAARSPRCRDLWSPNRGRVEKSPRRTSKSRKNSATPPRSPKVSWAKDGPGSPLFSHVMSKVKKVPLNSVVVNHVRALELGTDKENMAPAHLKPDFSPKVYRYTEDDPMLRDVFNNSSNSVEKVKEADVFNTSVDKLNQSIADVTFQFEELENEAQMLGEQSFQEDVSLAGDKDTILSQLAVIKQKQDELIQLERQLQKQLFRQKYGSPKTKLHDGQPKSAKKRLQMGRDENQTGVKTEQNVDVAKAIVPETILPETLPQETVIPEITERAARLDLSSETQVIVEKTMEVTKETSTEVKEVEKANDEDELIYQNVLPKPPLPPRSRLPHRIVSPEALRPKPPTPKVLSDSLTFSPQPMMTGAAQLFRCVSPSIEAPIQTPLALRSAALSAKKLSDRTQVACSALFQHQNSPIDLTVKSGNSSLNSDNNSASSPDITFSYLNENETTAIEVTSTQQSDVDTARSFTEAPKSSYPISSWTSMITDIQKTPAKSSTKLTDTVTTAISRNTVTMSSDSSILSSQVSVTSSPSRLTNPGSMSLLGNMNHGHTTGSQLHTYIVAATAQKYYDALMDDEVALFMDRLYMGQSQNVGVSEHGCSNPLASLLEHGDDMHFVPIREETESTFSPVRGSAFASYVCI